MFSHVSYSRTELAFFMDLCYYNFWKYFELTKYYSKLLITCLNRAAIIKSLEQLFLLGALTDECQLSDPVGHQMARLPLDPLYSKALILASQFNCLEEMLITVALLSVESIFYSPRDKLEEVWGLNTNCIIFLSYSILMLWWNIIQRHVSDWILH